MGSEMCIRDSLQGVYMRPRPTYALPSYPSAAPGAHLHLLQRARRAHHLPSARCYPGPARASAGGDLSARRLRKAAAQRLREGVGADICPAARCRPGCIGTGTCGVAARSKRAYQLTKRAKSARAVEEKLSGYARTGHSNSTLSPDIQPYPNAP